MSRVLAFAPVLFVTVGLFGGGLTLAVVQSLGGLPLPGVRAEWTAEAYTTLLTSASFWRSLGMSLWLAGAATALALVVGTLAALALWFARVGSGGRLLLAWTLSIPHVVAAFLTLLVLSQSGLLSRLTAAAGLTTVPADFPVLVNDPAGLGVLAELTWKEAPFVGLVVLAALARTDPRLLDVARSLGAGRAAAVRRVILPALRPALLSSGVLVFAFAFTSFEVPLLLGPTSPAPLPVAAYRAFTDPDLGVRREAMALSVLIAALGGLLVLGAALLARPRGERP